MRLASEVVRLLKKRNLRLCLAESLTGGLLSAEIVSVPGASEVFLGGFVSYTDEFKFGVLGVERELLSKLSAVSRECAIQMCNGARALALADVSLSLTGYAGPTGPNVGLCYIGLNFMGETRAYRYQLSGGRQEIREKIKNIALAILYFRLRGEEYGKGKGN